MKNKNPAIAVFLLMLSASALADDAADVRSTIERHYAAIQSNQLESAMADHRSDMTMFLSDGAVLWEPDWLEVSERMGATPPFGALNVRMADFNAQIYGNVAIATFYLVGTETRDGVVRDVANRVSAVWIKDDDGVWREAHHHESPLSPPK